MAYYLLNILSAWFLADLITGIVHWWEDHYLGNNLKYNFLIKLSEANDLHHSHPAHLTTYSLWKNIDSSVVVAWPLCLAAMAIGAPLWVVLTLFFASFANVVHRFCHEPPSRVNPLIKLFQKTGLFISNQHHRRHHYSEGKVILKENTSVRFCPMTNWVNPVLDRLKFFRILELILRLFGINPKEAK